MEIKIMYVENKYDKISINICKIMKYKNNADGHHYRYLDLL